MNIPKDKELHKINNNDNISVRNRTNGSAIKDLDKRNLKILQKLHQPLGECYLKILSNITGSVNR